MFKPSVGVSARLKNRALEEGRLYVTTDNDGLYTDARGEDGELKRIHLNPSAADQGAAMTTDLDDVRAIFMDGISTVSSDKQKIHGAVPFTIPTEGWSVDLTMLDYPRYIDIPVEGLSGSDIVDVNVSPASCTIAKNADFTNVESYDGTFRLRAKNVPEAEISAEYHITNTTNTASQTPSVIHNLSNYKNAQMIVQMGMAARYFTYGDQILSTWTGDDGKEYDFPWDVVDIAPVKILKNNVETEVPGLWLQAHYLPPAVQFDGNEAFYIVTEQEMAAGTYYFTMGNAWGTNVVKDKSYSFTTTVDIPVGGQLLLGLASSTTGSLSNNTPDKWRVWVYLSQSDLTPAEKLELTEAEEGTFLGTLSSTTKYGTSGLNNMQRSGYGYNRWGQSGIRQYLNSSDAIGQWWTPQNPYDRPPNELSTKRGFKAGFSGEFLGVLQPIKVVTALNTVSDSAIGTTEDTWDTFFLASLEQEYAVPQLANVEGSYWPYWKERLNLDSPQKSGTDNANAAHIRYALENHASAQTARLRSANRGYSNHTWNVTSTGNVYYNTATYANRPAVACVIC